MTAQHAQQLMQERASAKEQAADADDRLQDVKDLLMALQARFNSRWLLCHSCAWRPRVRVQMAALCTLLILTLQMWMAACSPTEMCQWDACV